ncbi:MAG TPA: hypothetical protein DCG22_01460 [Bacteroidetes bacterium]|nr:hypothetical protein [Bacteroidota bacterium]
MLTYSFIYTPLKKVSPIAVWVGAFPGAMPPLIGWAAATGEIGTMAVLLFTIQFMWQFPHFWSIAWVAFEDYAKADFYLLPASTGRDKRSAVQVVLYTVLLIGVSTLPFLLGYTGIVSLIITLAAGLLFLLQAIRLWQTCSDKMARQLMFGSFLYLPVVLIALFADKM